MKWWQIECTVPWESAEAVAALLHEWPEIQGVTLEGGPLEPVVHPEFGEWMDEELHATENVLVTVYLPDYLTESSVRARFLETLQRVEQSRVDIGDAKASVTVQLADESNWANAWKDGFAPMHIGDKLTIVPKWWDEDLELGDHIPLWIEPGMAFGTGTHATTQLCLQALQTMKLDGASVLDVGCGTAILAIAAAKLGASSVIAIDIDPVAVDAARKNVEDNGETENITVLQGDLLSPSLAPTYDFVVANILRDILIRLLPQATAKLAVGGQILVSGIVTSQEETMRQAMQEYGFTVERQFSESDWVALIGRKVQ